MSFADSSTVFLLSVTGQIASGTFLPEMDDLVRTKIKLTIDPLNEVLNFCMVFYTIPSQASFVSVLLSAIFGEIIGFPF